MDVADDMIETRVRLCRVEEVGDSGGEAATEARATMDGTSNVKGHSGSEFGKDSLDADLTRRGTSLKMGDLKHYGDLVADQERI
jgi:hypothetical protein